MSDEELIYKYVAKDKQEEALNKLSLGYPVQYIIGNVDFYNTIIKVNEDVLIPRFETEYLVSKTLNYIKKLNLQEVNVLEVGTGSGCISIAIKKNLNCDITTLDISKKAINVASSNAKENNVKINFLVEDIHKFKTNDLYDVIISNPPYVPFNSSYDEKIKYEPQDAIFAKEDGIYFYRIILESLHNNLKPNFLIAFEIGDKEGNKIKELAHKYLPGSYISIEKDYNNYERYLFITNKNIFD